MLSNMDATTDIYILVLSLITDGHLTRKELHFAMNHAVAHIYKKY